MLQDVNSRRQVRVVLFLGLSYVDFTGCEVMNFNLHGCDNLRTVVIDLAILAEAFCSL